MKKRMIPMPRPSARRSCSGDGYPEILRARRRGGKVALYCREVSQPDFRRSLEILRNMAEPVTGYPRECEKG